MAEKWTERLMFAESAAATLCRMHESAPDAFLSALRTRRDCTAFRRLVLACLGLRGSGLASRTNRDSIPPQLTFQAEPRWADARNNRAGRVRQRGAGWHPRDRLALLRFSARGGVSRAARRR